MTEPQLSRVARWGMPAILVLYLIVGSLFAVYTPAWQAPDEPAHYNYVRTLAEQHRFPVLKLGDYPAAYLEEIKAARFPPSMPIDPIRYEFHQPPLYYLLAVPIYVAFGGALLPLRLFSVVLGALLLLVAYWLVGELVPGRPFLALGVTAFVAFLPMHLTFLASVDNDTLSEVLLATALLLVVKYVKRSEHVGEAPAAGADTRLLVLLGITTGLGFVTKSSAYVALPIALLAIAFRHLWLDREAPSAWGTIKALGAYLLPALALAAPWWVRNVLVYGGLDFLGLGRHAQVVAGQLRTAEFLATHSFWQLAYDFVLTSFHSFWGQFGWMGVLLDQRLYQALAIVSAVAAVGFLAWLWQVWKNRAQIFRWHYAAGGLLALSGLFTMLSYLWYNTQFLQHQGRYLFPALIPIGLAVALGWREALRHKHAMLLAALAVLALVAARLTGSLSTWLLAMLVGTAVALVLRGFLPRAWNPAVQVVPYLLLVPLDLACLFLFIIPQLTP